MANKIERELGLILDEISRYHGKFAGLVVILRADLGNVQVLRGYDG